MNDCQFLFHKWTKNEKCNFTVFTSSQYFLNAVYQICNLPLLDESFIVTNDLVIKIRDLYKELDKKKDSNFEKLLLYILVIAFCLMIDYYKEKNPYKYKPYENLNILNYLLK